MNTSQLLIAIVPRLFPAIDGVGDYALNLARQLRQDFGIQTHFLVGDSAWKGLPELEGFPVSQVNERTSVALANALRCSSASHVLLHYVGYGYAKRGCPRWLIEGLKQWQSTTLNTRCVTMFHEVYASGSIWTSAFWLSSLQRDLAAQLAKMSDYIFTSKQSYADIIQSFIPNQSSKITFLPIFSGIGEPQHIPWLFERKRRLIVFGHKNSRTYVYNDYLLQLKQVCESLEIEEVCDIGVPTGLTLSKLIKIPVVEKGITSASEVSSILLNSRVSFIGFPPPNFLAKSSIFASYCSHGMISILPTGNITPVDSLIAGKHYWVMNSENEPLTLDKAQVIASNAHTWYQTHSLSQQAHIYATHLTSSQSETRFRN